MKKPSLFGKYLLLERLNVGGMAEVFIAKQFGVEGFERVLAIKKILPTMAEDDEFIAMFIDEARISVQLSHANVVHIHELGRYEGAYYIAMEYVSGKDLRALLERFRRRREVMPTSMAVFIASKICEGLDYAHRKKDGRGQPLRIIHRDVSPQNILLSYDGEVKIIDFGIAKAANRNQKTQAGILKGKFGYMSPEQVRGMEIDHRSDIFALGVIMYEMLTGEKLFVGESDFSTLEKVRNAEVLAPSALNPDITPPLEQVVLKALAREVEDRYQWASDLHEDLARFLLEGDVFSAKHLATFMTEAFAEDLLREGEKMERFAQIDRPDQMEPSGIVTALPPGPRPLDSTRPALGQAPLPLVSPAHLMGGSKVSAHASSTPSPQPRRATISVPPPTREELEAFDTSSDRTIIVAEGIGYFRDNLKTAIGEAPVIPGGGGAQGRSQASDATVLRPAVLLSDTSHDLKPIDTTGFHPAAREATVATGGATRSLGANRPRMVPGSDPISDATTIGPTPRSDLLAGTAGDDVSDVPSEDASDPEHGADHASAEVEVPDGADDRQHASSDQEEPASRPPRRAPRRLPPRPRANSSRRKLLLAIAGTGVLALVVLGAALVKFFLDGTRTGIVVGSTPRDMAFSVTVNPGGRTLTEATLQLELSPGAYQLHVRPTDQVRFATFSVPVDVEAGKMKLVQLDFDAHRRSTAPTPPSAEHSMPPEVPRGAFREPASLPEVAPAEALEAEVAQVEVAQAEALPETSGSAPSETHPPPLPERWAATILVDEVGAQLYVDGVLVGESPEVELEGLEPGRRYEGEARKAGFRPRRFTLENAEGRSRVVARLELVRDESRAEAQPRLAPPTPAKESEVSVSAPRDRGARGEAEASLPARRLDVDRAAEMPSRSGGGRRAARGLGKLICTTDPVGAEVIVDGRPTGRKTPVPRSQPIELPFGTHSIAFRLSGKTTPKREFVIAEEHQASPKLIKLPKGDL